MRKLMNKKAALAAIAALTLTTGIAGTAQAGSDKDANEMARAGAVGAKPAGESTELPLDQVLARLRTAGYSDIREVEHEGGQYEVESQDAQGQRVELYLDARTGEVMKEERDD